MAAEAAPHLHEFFKVTQAHMKKAQEEVMPLMFDMEAMQKKGAELKAELQEKTRPILEKSFIHHDTKKTGVLDPEEAAVFFSHFMAEEGEFLETVLAVQFKAAMDTSVGMMKGMFGDDFEFSEDVKAKIDEQFKELADMIKLKFKEAGEDYKANKAERDVVAFKIIDVNGDATIQKDEFIAIFLDEEKQKALMTAIGFDASKIAQEVLPVFQEKMKAGMSDTESCKQQ